MLKVEDLEVGTKCYYFKESFYGFDFSEIAITHILKTKVKAITKVKGSLFEFKIPKQGLLKDLYPLTEKGNLERIIINIYKKREREYLRGKSSYNIIALKELIDEEYTR